MSVTLLEFVVAGILLVVAWQIGIAIAPWVYRKLHNLKEELDETVVETRPDQEVNTNHKRKAGSNHDYRNN